ncbi:MAG: holo-ACP synthase [Thermoguttaceae bacterium]
MDVLGIGTDIIECERIAKMLEKHPEHFVMRVFTEAERIYCQSHKIYTQHFAGRWAAKEAVLKAIGTGWIAGIAWTDVEIANESSGHPVVRLHGGAAEVAANRGISEIQISISHCQSHAVAVAIAHGITIKPCQ